MTSPTRTVHCEDALTWLAGLEPRADHAFITSLPDVSELGSVGLAPWKDWFVDAARAVLRATHPDSVAVFYQTDIKKAGVWIDKGYLCQRAAEHEGVSLLWHKIVCRKPAGTVTFGRPSYAHALCFSQERRALPPPPIADVMPDMGATLWARGMGIDTCRQLVRFVAEHTPARTVVDPFCGKGSVLAAANDAGLNAIGVELSAKRARQARTLQWGAFLEQRALHRSRPDAVASDEDVDD